MKTDVWMPLYITDYLRDTMFLTDQQHGAYLLLLMCAWTSDGVLIDSDERFVAICRCTMDDWKTKIRPVVSQFFVIRDGKWTQKRVVKEKLKASLRREAGSKGGIRTQANRAAKLKQPNKQNSSEQGSENTADTVANLKTSPSPSPLPVPSPVPLPSPSMGVVGVKGGTGEEGEVESGLDDIPKSDGALEMQKRISIAFARKGPWTRTEEEALLEVVMRPQCFEEVDRVLRFRESCPAALKQVEGVAAVRQLLQHWTDILDKVNAGYRPGRTSRKHIEQDRAAAREDAAWKREYDQIMSMPEPKIGAP